jgi:hypothetical protein
LLSTGGLWKPTLLPPRRATVAPPHAAPEADCRRGLYALTSAGAAPDFVRSRGLLRNAIGAVIGQVFLWGCVVECERGWRASHAYPARLFAPLGRRGRVAFLSRRAADSARVAHALHAPRAHARD